MTEFNDILELVGNPIPAARPRVTRFKNIYDTQAKEKRAAKRILSSQWKNEPLEGPLSLDIAFHMPKPSSWSDKKKVKYEGAPHVSRPDTDNLFKFTMDAMTGIVFCDDRLVFDLKAIKLYSEQPKTIIKVKG